MRIWAVLELRPTGPLGLASLAGEMLPGGRTVLEHTVSRILKSRHIEGIAVLTEPGGAGTATTQLGKLTESVRVIELLEPDAPKRDAVRRSRKWSRDGWRLGIGQTMEVDAAWHFPSLSKAARELKADALMAVLPEAVLVDAELLDGLIDHGAPEGQPPLPSATCQVPGGFAGLFCMAGWLEPMAAQNAHYSRIFAWGAEGGGADPLQRPESWLAPLEVIRCEFRGAADARRYLEIAQELLRRAPGPDGLGPSAREAAGIVGADPALYAGRIPRFVEVELTTAGRVPFADTPQALEVPERAMSRETFTRLIDGLATYDDVCLTLGGVGDPLAHPDLYEFLRLARERGIYGLHVDTPGTLLDDAAILRLLDCDVDVVSVRLGANSADAYRGLTGRDDFERVAGNVERLLATRRESEREWPFVVVEAEKRVEVEGELIDFWDRWSKSADWPVIRPFSDYCGRMPDRATVHLNLAARTACRRMLKEMFVMADGRVPLCRMDFDASDPVGDVNRQSAEEIWTAGRLAALRAEQQSGRFDGTGLCPRCRDWDGI